MRPLRLIYRGTWPRSRVVRSFVYTGIPGSQYRVINIPLVQNSRGLGSRRLTVVSRGHICLPFFFHLPSPLCNTTNDHPPPRRSKARSGQCWRATRDRDVRAEKRARTSRGRSRGVVSVSLSLARARGLETQRTKIRRMRERRNAGRGHRNTGNDERKRSRVKERARERGYEADEYRGSGGAGGTGMRRCCSRLRPRRRAGRKKRGKRMVATFIFSD